MIDIQKAPAYTFIYANLFIRRQQHILVRCPTRTAQNVIVDFSVRRLGADHLGPPDLPVVVDIEQRAGDLMTTSTISPSDVCAVVVTYFPGDGCAGNLESLAPQVGKLLIVDNGSSAQSLEPIQAAALRLNAKIVRLGSNFGIAKALNVGLGVAREHGYPWLATFDQDSRATPMMIEEMFSALEHYPHPDQVAIITPCPVDRQLGVDLRYPGTEAFGADWRIIHCAGTSGNIVNVRVAFDAGGFDDSLFIDYVDFEFCLRLRRQGFRILEASRAKLMHSLGRMELRLFIFIYVPVTNHPPVRRYYMSRNRLILWRRYWKREARWVIRDIGWFLRETAYLLLYEEQVEMKIPMIVRGLCDGLRNVRGVYAPR
jgi:rhamnosyltransferase